MGAKINLFVAGKKQVICLYVSNYQNNHYLNLLAKCTSLESYILALFSSKMKKPFQSITVKSGKNEANSGSKSTKYMS